MNLNKLFVNTLIYSFVTCSSLFSIENSVIPMIEKFESMESLNLNKYPRNQLQEIESALQQKEMRLRIATYNILFNDCDHNLEFENRWPQRLPRIVELLNEMQPDIIGVQELYPGQLKDISPYMKNYSFVAKPCADKELNGIFYRTDRFELLNSTVLYMTKTPQVPSSETLTIVQLKDKKSGKSFALFNTHLAFSNVNKREFQARFIAEQVEILAAQMPVFLTGDLNTFPQRLDIGNLPFYDGDYIHRIFTKKGLKDAKEVSILGHLGPISTFSNADGNPTPFKGTGTPGVFLDHIYVSSGITVLMHAVQPGTVNGHYPSDHLPVLIDCVINAD